MSTTLHRSVSNGESEMPGSPRAYQAPWGRAQTWISLLVLMLLAYGAVMVTRVVPSAGLRWLSLAGLLGILAVGMLSVVRGYEVSDREVVVRRLLWRTRLPIPGLLEVRADPGLIRGSVRLLGNGGFLSTTGIFWNRRLGRYRLLANDASRGVLLRYADRTVVLAPEDPSGFARDVSHRAGLHA